MTDFSDTYETDNGMTLPEGVHVFARKEALGNVAILEDSVTLHRMGTAEEFPAAAVDQAAIAVVEIDSEDPASLARLERLRAKRPGLPVIAGLQDAPVRTVRSLLRKGVSDVLELPFSSEELIAAIVDVARDAKPTQPAIPTKLAPVVAVLGAAGGVGASTVATQLATMMSSRLGEGARTALIDLSLQSGDAGAYLDKSPRMTISHLFEAIDKIDDELMRSVAVDCGDDLDLFAAPDDIDPIESASADAIARMLRETRKRYSAVVLDMPSTLPNWAMPILLSADEVVVVGVGRISALRHVKRKLSLLQMLGRDRENISVVLNRLSGGLFKRSDVTQMEELLGYDVVQTLEEDSQLVEEAQLQGVSVTALQKRARLSRQIADLATSISAKIGKEY
ncbi:AAA family ATPase [Qipengyuania sp. GH38]|uniref:AAA family ATPase n=1 Tax=Qipengyuania intermedia TaxID=2867244 RepID=UPI001C869D69|nr:AAA family ATPase [Qipengyuania intermedia]MBX7513708.1 AAA family ATPase [Qipengyuania intermedia]